MLRINVSVRVLLYYHYNIMFLYTAISGDKLTDLFKIMN